MRIRTIKPEFWSDKRVATWDWFTRLFYVGLWSAADDHGRGSAEPSRLAAALFPYDLSRDVRDTLAIVQRGLATLTDEGRIAVYEVDGEQFFEIRTWKKHQKVDRPAKSRLPTASEEFARDSRDTRGKVPRVSGIRDQGSGTSPLPPEGDGGTGQPPSEPPASAPSEAPPNPQPELLAQAERVWSVWPKRIDTLAALVSIRLAIQRDGFERVLEGTRAIVEADAQRHAQPPGRYLPKPTEFFDASRYLDDPAQYGAREGGAGGGVPLGIRVRELSAQLDAHHGSPFRQQPDPTQTRDWWKLHRELQGLRVQLLDAEGEPLSVRVNQGKELIDLHVGNPDNALGSLEAKAKAEPEFRELRRKLKVLRNQMRGANGEGGEP